MKGRVELLTGSYRHFVVHYTHCWNTTSYRFFAAHTHPFWRSTVHRSIDRTICVAFRRVRLSVATCESSWRLGRCSCRVTSIEHVLPTWCVLIRLRVFTACAEPFKALLHIVFHYFRRPLSILVKNSPRTDGTSPHEEGPNVDRDTEELLLRKERSLQRRRLGRRILWDLGVWILLIPVGGGGLTWAIGREIGVW